MDTLETQFNEAQQRVERLTTRPGNEDLLLLYAYFKQATAGDVSGDAPVGFDIKARFKYNAWEKLSGMPAEEAMRNYIAVVDRLTA